MSKKIIIAVLIIAIAGVAGFVVWNMNKTDNSKRTDVADVKNVEGTLEEIMTKVYADIPEENLPMALGNIEVDAESVESFVGTTDINYKEILANESMVGSIAHSVVLVRLQDAKDAEAVVEKIKTNANPRKWICIEASNVVVKSKGDLVLLIMSNEELAPKLEANFDNL